MEINGTNFNSDSSMTRNDCRYSSSETIVDQKFILTDKTISSSTGNNLNRGHYLLPFKIPIPSQIPSSFNYRSFGMHGRIVYILEAEVSVQGILKRNLRSELVEITIRELSKDLVMPLQIVNEAILSSFWCTGGSSVELAAILDKNVYSPGDKISLRFGINSSNSKLKYVQVSLVRKIRIGPLERCRRNEKLLGRVRTGRIAGCVERRANFNIPRTEPFSFKGKLMECRYELQFRIRADWCYATDLIHQINVFDSLLPSYQAII